MSREVYDPYLSLRGHKTNITSITGPDESLAKKHINSNYYSFYTAGFDVNNYNLY